MPSASSLHSKETSRGPAVAVRFSTNAPNLSVLQCLFRLRREDGAHNRRISTISPGYLIAARACWPRLLPGSCRGLDGCRCLSGNVAGANRSWLFPTTMRYPLGKFDTVHLVL